MSHPRAEVRAAMFAALQNVAAINGRIFQYRRHPLEPDALPAIRFYVSGDEAVDTSIHNRTLPISRTVRVVVEVVVKAADAAESTVDDVCEQVESAIESFMSFTGRYTGTEIDSEVTADQQVVVARQSYEFLT